MTSDNLLQGLKSHGDDVRIHRDVDIIQPKRFSVGNHIAIDKGFYCTVPVETGDYVHIGPYVTVTGGIQSELRMGHFTTIAVGSRIICASEEYQGEGLVGPFFVNKLHEFHDNVHAAPVVFEDFASVATNVVVLPGVILAEGCVISACSLVNQSTQAWTIYGGIPARPIAIRKKDIMIAKARELGYQ